MDPRLLQQIEQYLRDVGLNATELRKRMDDIKNSTTEFNRELTNAQRHFAEMNSSFDDLSQQFKNVIDDLKKFDSTSSRINKSFKTLGGLADKLKYDAEDISRLNKKDLESLDKKARIELSNLKARKEELDAKFKSQNLSKIEIDQYRELQELIDENGQLTNDENNYIKQLLKLTRERLEEEEKINKALGISGKIVDGIVGALDKLGISSDFFENLKENMRDTAKSGDKWAVVMTGAKGIVKGIGDALKDPVTQLTILLKVINFFKDAALTANTQIIQLGKSLGTSAESFRENLVGIESASSNINVTTANLTEAFGQLAESTGLAYEYTADQLVTQVKLTKQVGLQADEAAQIQKFGVLTGKTSEETYQSFVKGLVASRNQFKVGVDIKKTLAEAAKVSGQLAANLGYNPERIAKAVVAMKAFGTTLEQTKSQGEALLNFESSLESELKAELLTGQQLNLERARAAALMGDQVKLAEELTSQGMTLEKFSSMNVLAQKSYAEALGLSADQLSDQLQKQKQAQESGKSLAQITEEEAAQALERQTIQDQFNQSITKLQSLIGNLLAGPLGTMLDVLVKILNVVNLILKPFTLLANLIKESTAASVTFLGVLGGIYAMKNRAFLIDKAQVAIEGIKSAFKTKEIAQEGLLATIKKRGFFKTLADAAMSAFKSLAGIPFVGPILGAAAAASAVALGMKLVSKGDDVVSPGYGKRVLSTPEGSIALNDKDTVIAGTNLGGGEGNIAPQIDLTPMIAAINAVKVSIDRLYSKDTAVNMDGKKVGTTLSQGSYKVA